MTLWPCAVVLLIAIGIASPALAGQSAPTADLTSSLPPRADTGKPAIGLPPAELAPEPDSCVPALPCGTRLLGEIRKDGAVEVQVPALRW